MKTATNTVPPSRSKSPATAPSRTPFLTRPDRTKLQYKPVWGTLFDIIPLAEEAYQRRLQAKLDALLPNTS